MLGQLNGAEGILPFYALLFLLAIPMLGCPPLVLGGVAAGVIVVGPVLLVATAQASLPYAGSGGEPTSAPLCMTRSGCSSCCSSPADIPSWSMRPIYVPGWRSGGSI
jgi:hypothetical protein